MRKRQIGRATVRCRKENRQNTSASMELSPLEPRRMFNVALSEVPVLSSNPSASVKIYLDFNGGNVPSWGSYTPGAIPAYDQDGDVTSFSDGELASIREIWARASEKYSPFNVDVTTVDPGVYSNGGALQVLIGGDGAWTGSKPGGVAYVNSFTSGSANIAFVFSKNLGSGNRKYTAEAIAHESGHTFGLQHISTWSGTTKTQEYSTGTSLVAPIMGNSYSAARGLWVKGTTSASSTTIQDQLAVITSTTNGFGYRADDYGDGLSTAAPLTISNSTLTASGIVEQMSDADYFKFTTAGGSISLNAKPAAVGPMLDLSLSLLNSSGGVVQSADTTALGESITATVPAGTYYVAVASAGSYGDIGQYSLSGTVTAAQPVDSVAAPTGLTATASSSTQVNLAWKDNATNETAYSVERSVDGGKTWTRIAGLAGNTTSYRDTTVVASTAYQYRVYAMNSTQSSAASNVASVTTPAVTATVSLLPPANVAASAYSRAQINLSWNDVGNETGYRVQRSLDPSIGWTTVANLAAGTTLYKSTSGMSADTTYYFRVMSLSGTTVSSASPVVSATTLAWDPAPTSPSDLTATADSSTSVVFTWSDNSDDETAFKFYRSVDGISWTYMGAVGADLTTAQFSGLTAGTKYYFRMCASNSGGYSGYTGLVAATTPAAGSIPAAAETALAGRAFSTQPVGTSAVFDTADDLLGARWAGLFNRA